MNQSQRDLIDQIEGRVNRLYNHIGNKLVKANADDVSDEVTAIDLTAMALAVIARTGKTLRTIKDDLEAIREHEKHH